MLMLRRILISKYGSMDDSVIKLALQMATSDIYVNRVMMLKKTTLPEVLLITERCLLVLLRMEDRCA